MLLTPRADWKVRPPGKAGSAGFPTRAAGVPGTAAARRRGAQLVAARTQHPDLPACPAYAALSVGTHRACSVRRYGHGCYRAVLRSSLSLGERAAVREDGAFNQLAPRFLGGIPPHPDPLPRGRGESRRMSSVHRLPVRPGPLRLRKCAPGPDRGIGGAPAVLDCVWLATAFFAPRACEPGPVQRRPWVSPKAADPPPHPKNSRKATSPLRKRVQDPGPELGLTASRPGRIAPARSLRWAVGRAARRRHPPWPCRPASNARAPCPPCSRPGRSRPDRR